MLQTVFFFVVFIGKIKYFFSLPRILKSDYQLRYETDIILLKSVKRNEMTTCTLGHFPQTEMRKQEALSSVLFIFCDL